jgi:hypothetical protein
MKDESVNKNTNQHVIKQATYRTPLIASAMSSCKVTWRAKVKLLRLSSWYTNPADEGDWGKGKPKVPMAFATDSASSGGSAGVAWPDY